MKAIFVEYVSRSGDSHSYPIASFSDDQVGTMERILLELKEREKNQTFGFYSGDYDAPVHNPPTLGALDKANEKSANDEFTRHREPEPMVKPQKPERVHHDNIGNDPLW